MSRVLVVEDSRALARALVNRLGAELGLAADVAATLAETAELLGRERGRYAIALLDLTLPDATDVEVVDLVVSHHVPVIVFTGDYDDALRAKVLARGVLDYVVKDSASELAYVVELVRRFLGNAGVEVLVVDDALGARRLMAAQLQLQSFVVHEASSGVEALRQLAEHPAIKLVITDYNMPGMDGGQLIARIREGHRKDSLAVIGLTSSGGTLSARLLKRGASDFITRPFTREEFFCRVQLNLERLEQAAELRELGSRDALTGLWNRRTFLERGARALAEAAEDGWPVTLALLGLDGLRSLNHERGHAAGDAVLAHVGRLLAAQAGEGELAARLGGGEFGLLSRLSGERAERHFEALRAQVAGAHGAVPGPALQLSASIGTAQGDADLEGLLKAAARALDEAKGGGGDRVVHSPRVAREA